MALEAIPQALWFFLPAFVANPMAVVFGGGRPIDLGRTLRDGERLFGDGKTWRGLVGGTASGAVLGFLLSAPFLALVELVPRIDRPRSPPGLRGPRLRSSPRRPRGRLRQEADASAPRREGVR